jgi:hypothetical protein
MQLPILTDRPSPGQTADALASLPMAGAGRRAEHPLPTTVAEMHRRGWDAVDVVFVTGDAYIDHPSFAMAILGRVLGSGRLPGR